VGGGDYGSLRSYRGLIGKRSPPNRPIKDESYPPHTQKKLKKQMNGVDGRFWWVSGVRLPHFLGKVSSLGTKIQTVKYWQA